MKACGGQAHWRMAFGTARQDNALCTPMLKAEQIDQWLLPDRGGSCST